jgi:predicted CoA-substrate-specific enzyme activase
MRLVAGIDCGSNFTKAVLLAQNGSAQSSVLGKGRAKSGINMEEAARTALEAALKDAGLRRDQVHYVATTGFGRYGVGFRDIQITEITSGARGAQYLFPSSRCVLDIGGQSTRAITMDGAGKVRTFKTNDKCAAGSGMFIVRAAKYLEIAIEDVGTLSLKATNPQPISSVCAVLAESEIINHVSAGVSVENILRGIHESLADRAVGMLRRAGMQGEVALIGGVALQAGMVKALEQKLPTKVNVAPDCDYVCALGAALLGHKRLAKKEQLASLQSVS